MIATQTYTFDKKTEQDMILRSRRMTNADKIRSMTDEELAIWIVKRTEGWGMPECDLYVQSWLDWLRQEVSDNG